MCAKRRGKEDSEMESLSKVLNNEKRSKMFDIELANV